jgi:CspA family cold shock protein
VYRLTFPSGESSQIYPFEKTGAVCSERCRMTLMDVIICMSLNEESEMSQREIGRVKWFNEKKGFGFIICDDGEVFVHYKDIDPQNPGFKTLNENDSVTFIKEKSQKGYKAQEVLLAEEEA